MSRPIIVRGIEVLAKNKIIIKGYACMDKEKAA
jgi:hypothetical protein